MIHLSILVLTGIASVLATQKYNYIVPAVSPLVHYNPPPSANLTNTTWQFDPYGNAWTRFEGSSANITWYGTGALVQGIPLGAQTIGFNGYCSGSCSALSNSSSGTQEVRRGNVSLISSGSLNITGYQYAMNVGGTDGVKSVSYQPKNVDLTLSPGWTSSETTTLSSTAAGASVMFGPPSNTSIFMLFGAVGQDQGSYSISVTPSLPGGMESNPVYNATSPVNRHGVLLYLAVLNEGTQYYFTIRNVDRKLDIEAVNYYWPTFSSASSVSISSITVVLGLVFASVLSGVIA